ncbi:MAG: tetratricopeptide repeat protein [Bacteroidales bacterium]|nr:tetratricopeptide repeat protein [Bacteroidales bacterium]
MKKIKNIALVALLQLIVLSGFAYSPDSLVAIGNRAYNQGMYDSALLVYNQVADQNLQSAQLFYNMGNAYFKNNNIPAAILYFEKAGKLAPSDENIQYNLNVANSMIVDKIEQVPELFYKNWWNYFYNLFNVDTWTVIALLSLVFLVTMVIWFVLTKSRSFKQLSFYLGLFLLLSTIAAFGLASQKYYYSTEHKEAIVFTPSITVKSSPTHSAVDLFVIHEGTKVRVLDHVSGWIEIRIPDGSIGWLPDNSIKEI